jgi:multidrug efflux pump subunit AcrA (membrane-fusion protein)
VSRSAVLLGPLAAVLLALATLSACSISTPPSPSASPESGLRGTAKSAGGPATSNGTTNVWPSSAVTVVAHKGGIGGPVVARVVADHAGRFSMDLPPGTYALVQANVAGQPKTVTVRAGEYAHVTLWQAIP